MYYLLDDITIVTYRGLRSGCGGGGLLHGPPPALLQGRVFNLRQQRGVPENGRVDKLGGIPIVYKLSCGVILIGGGVVVISCSGEVEVPTGGSGCSEVGGGGGRGGGCSLGRWAGVSTVWGTIDSPRLNLLC